MNDESELLDMGLMSELRNSVGGDEAFVRELVGAYLAESPSHLEAIAAAAAAGDASAVVRPAHTLKSSSAAIGASRLAAVAKRLELEARAGRIDSAAVEEAQSSWPQTVAALAAAGMSG